MEENVSRLVRQFAQSPSGSPQREEARRQLVEGTRAVVESLLELTTGRDKELRAAALSTLADIVMSIHQASFSARHLQVASGVLAARTDASVKLAEGARLFGEVAIERGLARVEQILKALNTQKREVLGDAQPRLIGEILVAEGVLTPAQVKTILMAIRSRLLRNIEEQLAATAEPD